MTDPYDEPWEDPRADALVHALFDGWTMGSIAELANHGADAGWPGITYTSDILELYRAHTDALWDHAQMVADDMGVTVHELQGYSKNPSTIEDEASLATWLVWLAAETLARVICPDE